MLTGVGFELCADKVAVPAIQAQVRKSVLMVFRIKIRNVNCNRKISKFGPKN
jgi:hypothetical protein